MANPILAQEIRRTVSDLPYDLAVGLADVLSKTALDDWTQRRSTALAAFSQPALRQRVDALLSTWQTYDPEAEADGVALAILSSAAAEAFQREQQRVELVWTGPNAPNTPLRHTGQVLQQVIDAAQRDLLVVSFAVYNIGVVVQALVAAAERGVRLRICLEAPEPGGQRLAYDTLAALGPEVGHLAQLYIWPLDQRPVGPGGKPASLHVKCAVADGDTLFISSANLTKYAMALNMELGVLIKGGELPGRVASHFERLIENGTLRRMQQQEQGG